jgi:hypothetical protein
MLIEIWEKLRGYDRWVEAETTVESTKGLSYPVEGGTVELSADVLLWTDADGGRHRAAFTVPETSPLYQLVRNSTTTIRYNPADPEQYYLRELLQTRARTAAARIVVFALFIGFALSVFFLRSKR